MNFQISGQKIKTKKQTKYLGIVIDGHYPLKHIQNFKTHQIS